MDLSIVIVNYHSRRKLLPCLDSIIRADNAGLNYEIIVVENASGEDLSDLPAKYKDLGLINSASNLGMGGGNNLGIRSAKGEFILVLNPDTLIRGRAIVVLLDYLKAHPEVGIIGPKLVYADNSLQLSCARFPRLYMPILRRTFLGEYFEGARDYFLMSDFDHNAVRDVDWLMGSCLMFRKEIILPSGQHFVPTFDERYFMYFEDVDLCRTAWSKGLKVVYNPEAVIVHDHARESAKHPWYIAMFTDHLAHLHIISWIKYHYKWGLTFKKRLYEND